MKILYFLKKVRNIERICSADTCSLILQFFTRIFKPVYAYERYWEWVCIKNTYICIFWYRYHVSIQSHNADFNAIIVPHLCLFTFRLGRQRLRTRDVTMETYTYVRKKTTSGRTSKCKQWLQIRGTIIALKSALYDC